MSKYHELTASYILSDEEMKILQDINWQFREYVSQDGQRPFADQTIEGTFNNIMVVGSRPFIKERFGFAMLQMGMISMEEWNDKRNQPIEEWKNGEDRENKTSGKER